MISNSRYLDVWRAWLHLLLFAYRLGEVAPDLVSGDLGILLDAKRMVRMLWAAGSGIPDFDWGYNATMNAAKEAHLWSLSLQLLEKVNMTSMTRLLWANHGSMQEVVCARWTSWGFGQIWSPSTLSWCDQGALFSCSEQDNANSRHFEQFKMNNYSFLAGMISRLLCRKWKTHISAGRLWASWSVELCGGYSAGHEGWQPSPRQAPTRSWGSHGGIHFHSRHQPFLAAMF